MILDSKLQFSDSQALTATAVSTNVIDQGAARDAAVGEPMAVVVNVEVAAGGTTPTLQVSLQTDDNAAFASGISLLTTQVYAEATLVAGFRIIIPLTSVVEQFLRLNYVMSGTTPTLTVSAHLMPMSMIQNEGVYLDAITIS